MLIKLLKDEVRLHYCFISDRHDLALCFDDLCEAVARMLRRTGAHGQSPEMMIRMLVATVGLENTFLLTAYDEHNKFQGFVYAMFIGSDPAWVDIIGVWTRPGIGVQARGEVFDFLKEWALAKGATKIMAGIVRSPEVFFKNFHEPLGFKKIGFIVEYDLGEKEDAN